MLFYFFNLCCVYDVAKHNSFGKQQTKTADNFPSWPKWKTRLFFTLQDDCVHCKNLNSEGKDKMSKNKISKKQWFLDYIIQMQLPQDTDPRRFNLCKFDINRLPLLYRIYNMYINSIFDKNRLPLLDRIYNIYIQCIWYKSTASTG